MAIRTSSKTVRFTRPFTLEGLDGEQRAGSYTVETDEELLPTVLSAAYRRTATWILVPPHAMGAGLTHLITIDPMELDAALMGDASADWSAAAESRVDDLLADNVMRQTVHSAGLTLHEFKEQLRDLASRLGRMRDGEND